VRVPCGITWALGAPESAGVSLRVRSDVIDPESFPFTERELRRALALVMEPSRARDEAGAHAEGMRREMHYRAAFFAQIRAVEAAIAAGGALPAAELGRGFGYGQYVWYREDALTLLSLASAALATRVRTHRLTEQMRSRPSRERQAVWRATGAVDVPVPAEIAARLDAEDTNDALRWARDERRMRRRVQRFGANSHEVRT
jgi:heme exporter protein D